MTAASAATSSRHSSFSARAAHAALPAHRRYTAAFSDAIAATRFARRLADADLAGRQAAELERDKAAA